VDSQKSVARNAFGLSRDAFVIGGVGRLVPQKNFAVFLDVAAQVITKNEEVIFVIAGTGQQENELKVRADALGLGNSVRFLGHVTDRVSLYHSLNVLLMTSDFEGTPMTLLEAMACGLPVVASAVDGVAEVCKNEWDALLVPPRYVRGFVSALERVLGEEGLARKLGANARATILERYEIRGLVRRIEALYEEVLEEQQ
jgi:glycosyltransferase involved in cell wall biosynthesis